MANNVNVVNRGFEYICQWMANTALTGTPYSNYTIPSYVGWGGANGSNATSTVLPASQPAPSSPSTAGTGQWMDVGPFQEFSETRVNGTPATLLNNSAGNGTIGTQFVATITATGAHTATTNAATGQIAESFLVFSSTKPLAFTVVGAQASTTATLLTVNTSGGLANQYYQMNNEVIKISSTAASNVWTIVRAQNGSTANAAASGDTVTLGNVPGAGASNPSNADLFAHAGFIGLSLNNGDSVQFTWQINVTS